MSRSDSRETLKKRGNDVPLENKNTFLQDEIILLNFKPLEIILPCSSLTYRQLRCYLKLAK